MMPASYLQVVVRAYLLLHDNYQFKTKLKSFCIWGRLNISFFTFATLKTTYLFPFIIKRRSDSSVYFEVKVDTKNNFFR